MRFERRRIQVGGSAVDENEHEMLSVDGAKAEYVVENCVANRTGRSWRTKKVGKQKAREMS
jgi:hypothetical protein